MLRDEQLAYLQAAFRLRSLTQADERSVAGEAMQDEQTCREVLTRVMPLVGAPDLAIAASLLSKRIAFLASGCVLYAMSVFDSGLLISLSRCRLEYAHDDGLWTSSLPLDVVEKDYAPGARDEWREAVVSMLFRGFFSPLWQSLSQVSGVPEHILWENTAVRIYSLYQGRMEGLNEQQEQQKQSDYNWLLKEADPALFGLPWNPLKRFRRPLQKSITGTMVRFRRTCCFYYKAAQPEEYCQNCPLLRMIQTLP
jgi:ferric iron reductase protein FhuF